MIHKRTSIGGEDLAALCKLWKKEGWGNIRHESSVISRELVGIKAEEV
jgi:hypothetical protein